MSPLTLRKPPWEGEGAGTWPWRAQRRCLLSLGAGASQERGLQSSRGPGGWGTTRRETGRKKGEEGNLEEDRLGELARGGGME